jgi:hypothetical protein
MRTFARCSKVSRFGHPFMCPAEVARSPAGMVDRKALKLTHGVGKLDAMIESRRTRWNGICNHVPA